MKTCFMKRIHIPLLTLLSLAVGLASFSQNVGIGTISPLARLHVDKDVLFSSGATSLPVTPANPPVSGAGIRLMWYPDKAAFRVGSISGNDWDRDSIGDYSFASGNNTQAKGNSSTSMGSFSTASGDYSVAIGKSAASGDYSVAIGKSTASKDYSVALGMAIASGDYSVALGKSTASGNYSTAIGNSTAFGGSSTAMGGGTKAIGDYSTSMGYNTSASGLYSTSIGNYSTASGYASTAMGNYTTASVYASTAMGSYTTASGYASTAMGSNSIASNSYSTAIGYNTIAKSVYCLSIGMNNDTSDNPGLGSSAATDRIFQIGNGFSYRSNALTILRNGNIGVGNNNAPARPVSFPAVLGEKILLYPGANGEVGIGVYGNELRLHCDNPGSIVSFGTQDNAGNFTQAGRFQINGAYALYVNGSIWANGTTYASDERYKQNITAIQSPVQKLMQINGVEYDMKITEFPKNNFPAKRQIGLLAQNVEKVVPEAVNELDGYKGVDYAKLVPLLIEAVKEQQHQIEDLKATVKKLSNQ